MGEGGGEVKGYKGFDKNLKCHGKQYEQEEKWGEQNRRMLFNPHEFISTWLETFREDNENKSSTTWFSILMEEVCEAFAETDMEKQREEMVQIADVAVQIIEYLDRRMEARHEKEK
jgi:hypothetical protein